MYYCFRKNLAFIPALVPENSPMLWKDDRNDMRKFSPFHLHRFVYRLLKSMVFPLKQKKTI